MKIQPKQIIIVAGILVFAGLIVLLFVGGARPPQPTKIPLRVWGVNLRPDAFFAAIGTYGRIRPNIEVAYQEFNEAAYRTQLVNALAAGTGPDIFMIHNRSLPRERAKLHPAFPAQITTSRLADLFPQVVEQDFVLDGEIYALPLFIDTLVLFYNRDFFDQAAIVAPPKTWDEFQEAVVKLRAVSPSGRIERAGAAIGGSEATVNRGVDLLQLLMLQNGTQMAGPGFGSASFAAEPGLRAFNFYLSFANPLSGVYTWNDNEPPALESFASGKSAMIFGYQKDIPALKERSPFLNFGVAPVPQLTGASRAVSYADYWGFAVSKQSKNPGYAWDLVLYFTAIEQNAGTYLGATGEPPALRSLIGAKTEDPALGLFARQALTARSWYQADEDKIREIFNQAIVSVLTGKAAAGRALSQAEAQVSELMWQQ